MTTGSTPDDSNGHSSALRRVIAHIHTHYSNSELSLDDLAKVAGFSRWHFTRIFTRHTQMSPARYINQVRIENAQHLLATTTMTVADIATAVGRDSVGTFGTWFRQMVGCSPTEYRQRHHTTTSEATP